MKIIRTFIFVVCIAAIEITIIQDIVWNSTFYIDFLAIIALLASLKYGWVHSGCLIFGSGMLQDSLSGSPLGVGSVSFAAGCLFSGSVCWILFSEHVSTRLVMVFLGSIIIILTRIILESMYSTTLVINPTQFFLQTALPTATLNMLLSVVLYPVLSRYIFVRQDN